jgi:hypothetical protein
MTLLANQRFRFRRYVSRLGTIPEEAEEDLELVLVSSAISNNNSTQRELTERTEGRKNQSESTESPSSRIVIPLYCPPSTRIFPTTPPSQIPQTVCALQTTAKGYERSDCPVATCG